MAPNTIIVLRRLRSLWSPLVEAFWLAVTQSVCDWDGFTCPLQLCLMFPGDLQQLALAAELFFVLDNCSFKDSEYFLGGWSQSLVHKLSQIIHWRHPWHNVLSCDCNICWVSPHERAAKAGLFTSAGCDVVERCYLYFRLNVRTETHFLT